MSRSDPPRAEKCKRSRRRLFLLYHDVTVNRLDYIYAIHLDDFKRHVECVMKIRQDQPLALWPELTFDDGQISNYENTAPVLESCGLRARFVITVGWTGVKSGYMGWDQVKALHRQGHSIGSHGWSHAFLTRCSPAELGEELKRSKEALEEKLGSPVMEISMPGGRFNRRVLEACREIGYTKIFTSEPVSEGGSAELVTGRANVNGDASVNWIAEVLEPQSKVLRRSHREYLSHVAMRRLLGYSLYKKLWTWVNRHQSSEPVH